MQLTIFVGIVSGMIAIYAAYYIICVVGIRNMFPSFSALWGWLIKMSSIGGADAISIHDHATLRLCEDDAATTKFYFKRNGLSCKLRINQECCEIEKLKAENLSKKEKLTVLMQKET